YLVGRKLPMRAGGAISDLVAAIDATAAEASDRGGELADIGKALADAAAELRHTVEWLLVNGADDPNNALAGATPFLRMAGLVVGGWMLTRGALAAADLADAGDTT